MAQVVGYFENDVVFIEGPFVAVNANGWRVEAELEGNCCPAFPDLSVDCFLEKEKGIRTGKWVSFEAIAPIIDWLNEQVKAGHIIKEGRIWIVPEKPVCTHCLIHCP